MRYAIISDIHGDILALEEALKEIEKVSFSERFFRVSSFSTIERNLPMLFVRLFLSSSA